MGNLKIGKSYPKFMLELANKILIDNKLCDNCLGRQFALLGHGLTNRERGKAIKLFLLFEGHRLVSEEGTKGLSMLEALANNGISFELVNQILTSIDVKIEKQLKKCHLCEGRFEHLDELAEHIVEEIAFIFRKKCFAG